MVLLHHGHVPLCCLRLPETPVTSNIPELNRLTFKLLLSIVAVGALSSSLLCWLVAVKVDLFSWSSLLWLLMWCGGWWKHTCLTISTGKEFSHSVCIQVLVYNGWWPSIVGRVGALCGWLVCFAESNCSHPRWCEIHCNTEFCTHTCYITYCPFNTLVYSTREICVSYVCVFVHLCIAHKGKRHSCGRHAQQVPIVSCLSYLHSNFVFHTPILSNIFTRTTYTHTHSTLCHSS